MDVSGYVCRQNGFTVVGAQDHTVIIGDGSSERTHRVCQRWFSGEVKRSAQSRELLAFLPASQNDGGSDGSCLHDTARNEGPEGEKIIKIDEWKNPRQRISFKHPPGKSF